MCLLAYLVVEFYDARYDLIETCPFLSCSHYIAVKFSMFHDLFFHLSMLWSSEFLRPIFFWVYTRSQSCWPLCVSLCVCTYFLPGLLCCVYFSWDLALDIKGNSAPFPNFTHLHLPQIESTHSISPSENREPCFLLISVRHHSHYTEARTWVLFSVPPLPYPNSPLLPLLFFLSLLLEHG